MKDTICDKTQRRHALMLIFGIMALTLVILVSVAGASPYAYITNGGGNTVSVIDIATNTVTSTVNVGNNPSGVTVTPDGAKVYVANWGSNTVSTIDTATNTVTATVPVGSNPYGVAVTPYKSKVYVANYASNTVSVIDTAANKVTASVNVGKNPYGVAVAPDGTTVYVTNWGGNTVSLIDVITNTVTATVSVGNGPWGIAVSPDGSNVYVANYYSSTVSVISIATNSVTTVPVGSHPSGIAINPDGTKVYVVNFDNTVSIINTATNSVTVTVDVGAGPDGISVTPDGKKVYVANYYSGNVSVIDTTNNTVAATVNVGSGPIAFGQFIVPAPSRFSIINVVGTNYQYQAWGQYPLINLFGKNNVPLLSNTDPIWKSHVDKLAKLVSDSSNMYTLKSGDNLNLGQGYSLQVLQVDIDGQKVWLEFDYNGQYVDDAIVSTDSGDHTWTCVLNNIQGVNNVPVLKVHVNRLYEDSSDTSVEIDGLWLIDYKNATTLKVGDKFGIFYRGIFIRGYILTKIINGVDASFLGELVFKKYP